MPGGATSTGIASLVGCGHTESWGTVWQGIHSTGDPMTDQPFLLPAVLAHNPTVRKALAAEVPDLDGLADWLALSEALSGGAVERIVAAFLGNKSERVMLAAVLMKADYASAAVEISGNFWLAWGGLDRRNKMLLLALLDEDLE